jgi:hypothetical protein
MDRQLILWQPKLYLINKQLAVKILTLADLNIKNLPPKTEPMLIYGLSYSLDYLLNPDHRYAHYGCHYST